jgi:hypothetical protein
LLIEDFKLSTTAAHQAPGRLSPGKSDDLRAFQLCEARLAPRTVTVTESIYTLAVEPMEAFPNGLWMTAEFLGDPGGA